MRREASGRHASSVVGGEAVRAFVPFPLPPAPPLQLTGERQGLLERATPALGRLDSIALLLPDPQLFLYAYVRREAVLSSQIEGTQFTKLLDAHLPTGASAGRNFNNRLSERRNGPCEAIL